MSERETIYLAVNLPVQADQKQRLDHLERIQKAATKAAGRKAAHVTLYSSTDAIEQEADRIKRAAYWADVRGIVDDAKRAICDLEITSREGLHDWLHETIDGCSRVIYTAQAMEGLHYSDNDGAYFDDFGAEGAVEDGAIQWSRLMYAAMERDVIETIGEDDNGEDIINSDGYCPECAKAGKVTCTPNDGDSCDEHQDADEDEDGELPGDDQGEDDDSNEAIRRRLEGGE